MNKTDTQLRLDVLDELKWEPGVDESEIGVAVKGQVVTLTGYVPTYAQKYHAERIAERVTGVRGIAEELKVTVPNDLVRTDTDIARAIIAALDWHVEVPDTVKVKVETGWVTLDGTVEWQFQRVAAEKAARYLTGVKGINNLINVKPKMASAFEVSKSIKAAFQRNAQLDAEKIAVLAQDGKVTLKGTVRSWTEREDAERAAWGAPGVKIVDDQLAVRF
jgi:osmotically-inducible protein OsmY